VFHGVRPNPWIGELAVEFSLSTAGPGSLEMFDMAGRRVWSRDISKLGAGRHTTRISSEADGLPPGVYLVRLGHGFEGVTRKIVRLAR
jgi:hypothetical protein